MLETRMIIIKPAQQSEDEDIFFLKNTSEQYIGEDRLLLSTTIKKSFVSYNNIIGTARDYIGT